MLYIPFTFKVDGRPDTSIFQSIIAAEGIAPYAAKTFVGMGSINTDSPRITGGHPLNPFADRVLLFSKIPVLPSDEYYSDVWHMTAFVEVNEEDIQVIGAKPMDIELHDGLQIRQAVGAVLFNKPQRISFVFADETNYDYRMGSRATPCGKHEGLFSYMLLSDARNNGAETCVLSREDLERVLSIQLVCGKDEIDTSVCDSEFTERSQGAELGYASCQYLINESEKIMTSLEKKRKSLVSLKLALANLLPAEEAEKQLSAIAEIVVDKFEKQSAEPDFCKEFDYSRKTIAVPDTEAELLKSFCKLLCKHPFQEWNWPDNEMRSRFTQMVLDQCIIPILHAENDSTDFINRFQIEMELVKRHFDEPYTYLLNEEKLSLNFVTSFLKVMNSEGRADRIKEVLISRRNDDMAIMTWSLYGAMCGYAGFPMKRLFMAPEILTDNAESRWIQKVVKQNISQRKPKKYASNKTTTRKRNDLDNVQEQLPFS